MNPDAFAPPLESCEAFQQQISESADAGTPLAPELLSHLQSCAACRRFAEIWFPAPPAALTRPVPVTDDSQLRERILKAAARAEVIPFPVAAHRVNRIAWIGRAAACLAFAGLAYWLLNPKLSVVHTQSVAATTPTLAQSLAQVEDGTKREQQVLQTALVDGGQHVGSDVEWTMSALEL